MNFISLLLLKLFQLFFIIKNLIRTRAWNPVIAVCWYEMILLVEKNAIYSVCTSNERLKTVASNDFILIGFCFGLIRTNKSQVSQNVDCFPWKYSERKTKNNFEIIHLHKILSNLTRIRARKLILLVCDNIRTVHIVIFICSQSPAFPNRKQNSVNLFWKISAVRKSDGHNVILTHRWG